MSPQLIGTYHHHLLTPITTYWHISSQFIDTYHHNLLTPITSIYWHLSPQLTDNYHHNMVRPQDAEGEKASGYRGQLRVYWISSGERLTRSGAPAWRLGEVLATPHRKNLRSYDGFHMATELVAKACECGNESLRSIRCVEFLDYLRICSFLKMASAPWILLVIGLQIPARESSSVSHRSVLQNLHPRQICHCGKFS